MDKLLITLPEKFKQSLKVMAAKKKTSMTRLIIEALQQQYKLSA